MFDALGRLTYERRWLVLAAATTFMVFALLWGSGVLPELKGGGFEQPSSDGARARTILDDALGRDDPT